MDAITGVLPALTAQWEGAAQWLYYDVIFDFLHREIDTFRDNMLHEMMRWVGGSATVLVVLWMAWFGIRILQGKVHYPMEGVVDTARVAFVVTVAMTMTLGNGHLYAFLVNDLPMEITQVMTGKDQHPEDMVNQSLARMEAAMVAIDALNFHDGSENLQTDKDRAQWLAGVGAAGPALMGGALLVTYRMALALFVGFAPLFILSLLFKPTQTLFQKWLLYGVGTLFGQAVLAFCAVLMMKIVLATSAVFIAFYVAAATAGLNPVSVSSAAMMQGGIGFLLTLALLLIPPMATYFFQGTLGSFLAFSVFGRAGGGRSRSEASEYDAQRQTHHAPPPQDSDGTPSPFQFRLPQQSEAQGDAIKRLAPSDESDGSFLQRHPNALASNQLLGMDPRDDITTLERVRVTAPQDERFADVMATVDSSAPSWMQPYNGPEFINYARRMEQLDPHIRTADMIDELNAARLLTPADRDAVRQAYAALQAHPVRPIYDPTTHTATWWS